MELTQSHQGFIPNDLKALKRDKQFTVSLEAKCEVQLKVWVLQLAQTNQYSTLALVKTKERIKWIWGVGVWEG